MLGIKKRREKKLNGLYVVVVLLAKFVFDCFKRKCQLRVAGTERRIQGK